MHACYIELRHRTSYFFILDFNMAARRGTLTVCVGEELLARINTVAKAHRKSQAQFVKDVLHEKTIDHKEEVEAIAKLEQRIVEREHPH
jgi:hypothetical protein